MKTTAELQDLLDALKQWQDAEPKDWMLNTELIELIEEILRLREYQTAMESAFQPFMEEFAAWARTDFSGSRRSGESH